MSYGGPGGRELAGPERNGFDRPLERVQPGGGAPAVHEDLGLVHEVGAAALDEEARLIDAVLWSPSRDAFARAEHDEVRRLVHRIAHEGARATFRAANDDGRELNTIGSKSAAAEISSLVVDAKAALEKVREQVQNVE